jgi:hypothetical protein
MSVGVSIYLMFPVVAVRTKDLQVHVSFPTHPDIGEMVNV